MVPYYGIGVTQTENNKLIRWKFYIIVERKSGWQKAENIAINKMCLTLGDRGISSLLAWQTRCRRN